jgi:hypothetical protein
MYKADHWHTYYVVLMSTNVTAAALTPKLDQKLPASAVLAKKLDAALVCSWRCISTGE